MKEWLTITWKENNETQFWKIKKLDIMRKSICNSLSQRKLKTDMSSTENQQPTLSEIQWRSNPAMTATKMLPNSHMIPPRWSVCEAPEVECPLSAAAWTHQSKSRGRHAAGRIFHKLWHGHLLLYWPVVSHRKYSSFQWQCGELSGLLKSVKIYQKISHISSYSFTAVRFLRALIMVKVNVDITLPGFLLYVENWKDADRENGVKYERIMSNSSSQIHKNSLPL